MTSLPAAYWIDRLHLTRHVEGGWYGEVYRADLLFTQQQLPDSFTGTRPSSTHIYFLLEKGNFSAFHRIKSDELWHFYYGDPLTIYEIDKDGKLIEHLLGNDPSAGQSFFCCIKAGNWFGSKVNAESNYSLVGCTVSPGFDFADFEMADRSALLKEFPHYEEIITTLTR